jgi:hypothetical protein
MDDFNQGQVRLVLRAAGDYMLRQVELTSRAFDNDPMMGVIYLAVLQANIRPIADDPRLSRAYAGAEPPPDSVRIPVTARAVAESLNLPRETTRRYINRLVAMGHCNRIGRQGVVVPQAVLVSPEGVEFAWNTYANLRRLFLQLRDLGVEF